MRSVLFLASITTLFIAIFASITGCGETVAFHGESIEESSVLSASTSDSGKTIISVHNTVNDIPAGYMDSKMGYSCVFDDGSDRYYVMNRWLQEDSLVVEYDDGSTENWLSAFRGSRSTISDLDRFGIDYKTRPKSETDVVEIRYNDARISLLSDVGMPLLEDEAYVYVVSKFIYYDFSVLYEDGSLLSMGEAAASNRISIEDLDFFGFPYTVFDRE